MLESAETRTPVAIANPAGSRPRSASTDHQPAAMPGSARQSAPASCNSCRARSRCKTGTCRDKRLVTRASVTRRADNPVALRLIAVSRP